MADHVNKHKEFEEFDWNSNGDWQSYINSITIPDPSKQNEIILNLKKKWYKKNIDPHWEEQKDIAPILDVFPVGPLNCNCSIFADPTTKEGVVVDPGGNPDEITKKLALHKVTVKYRHYILISLVICLNSQIYILITHAHFDHILAADIIKKATGAPVILHKGDLQLWQMKELQCSLFGIEDKFGKLSEPEKLLEADEELTLSQNIKGKTLHTPGHTPGSTCFLFESAHVLFSGDTLFKGSVGRTDLWGGDKNALMNSIRTKLYPLPDNITVVSGHGANTTIGTEKKTNPFLRGSNTL